MGTAVVCRPFWCHELGPCSLLLLLLLLLLAAGCTNMRLSSCMSACSAWISVCCCATSCFSPLISWSCCCCCALLSVDCACGRVLIVLTLLVELLSRAMTLLLLHCLLGPGRPDKSCRLSMCGAGAAAGACTWRGRRGSGLHSSKKQRNAYLGNSRHEPLHSLDHLRSTFIAWWMLVPAECTPAVAPRDEIVPCCTGSRTCKRQEAWRWLHHTL